MNNAATNDADFPALQSKPSTKHCSNCSSKMSLYTLPGHYGSHVEIDVCMDCNAIWFDQFESIQLSPDGTVRLFQLIHERGGTAASGYGKFGEGLRCITCGDGMKLTQDRVKGSRFSYQACRKGHGRFTTFYNFLMEKQFVRELTIEERAKLSVTVKQIRCSGCGAAVNIGKVDACEYCRAPVSVFDRGAAKKAIDHYLQERQKHRPASTGERRESGRAAGDQWSSYDRANLGTDILFALGRAATRIGAGAGRAVPAVAAGAVLVDSGAFADAGAGALPDATSALFGSGVLSGAASTASTGIGSVVGAGMGDSVSETVSSFGKTLALAPLPSATDALFGGVSGGIGEAATGLSGEIAGAFGEAATSGLGEAAASVASDLGSGAYESVSGNVIESVSGHVIESVSGNVIESVTESGADLAGDIASSAGEGVVDLVSDGIGSLLGSIFN